MVASEIKSTMPLPGPRDLRAWVPCGPRGRCEAGGGGGLPRTDASLGCKSSRRVERGQGDEGGGIARWESPDASRHRRGDDNSLSRQSRGRKELLP